MELYDAVDTEELFVLTRHAKESDTTMKLLFKAVEDELLISADKGKTFHPAFDSIDGEFLLREDYTLLHDLTIAQQKEFFS